jgi:hypothetical protein
MLRLATALEYWWEDRGLWAEGRRWIEDAFAADAGRVPAALRADALRVLARLSAAEAERTRTRSTPGARRSKSATRSGHKPRASA